jgi:hypothetical protein
MIVPDRIAHSNTCTPAVSQNTAAIEVLQIEPGQTPGVLAVVAVKVGGILIRGVRVTNRGRGTFCNMPSRKFDDKWVELVEITSPALRAATVEVILAAVRGANL